MSNAPTATTADVYADRLIPGDVLLLDGYRYAVAARVIEDDGDGDLRLDLTAQETAGYLALYPGQRVVQVPNAGDPRRLEPAVAGEAVRTLVDPFAFRAWRAARTDAELAR